MRETIRTKRLSLSPCSAERMAEKRETETDPHLKRAYGEMLAGMENHPDVPEWYADWDIVLCATGEVVGGAGFKGGPGETGDVEVGYGIDPAFQNRGLMTEALEGLAFWALSRPGVRAVLAEAEPGNEASVRVLKKNGFQEISRSPNRWFRKTKEEGNP